MSTHLAADNLTRVLQAIDIPDSAYERANWRYEDLGDFFAGEAESAQYDPHIYPQGSFRLGTVVRPLTADDEYDLDVGCRLRSGVTKASHTQADLKHLVGRDLLAYRVARQIEKQLEEKRRCWRLGYKDDMKFHMDVVPSIPEDVQRRALLREAIVANEGDGGLAERVATHAGAITDNKNLNYRMLSANWRISNSEGYALWFQSRMMLARELVESSAVLAKTTVDALPTYRWKSPLQESVRLLKRHRDVMFEQHDGSKPISAIITTLAARAYRGERTVQDALDGILARMGSYVRAQAPRVPNPVNPAEDFADKWPEPENADLHLEKNFHLWLAQAQIDFAQLRRAGPVALVELARRAFKVPFSANVSAQQGERAAPAVISSDPPDPWRFG